MYWDVIEVRPLADHTLWAEFADGVSGRVRFADDYFTGVFTGLRNPDEFARVFIDQGTVAWPGGIDLAPDAMHREIKAHGEWRLSSSKRDAPV